MLHFFDKCLPTPVKTHQLGRPLAKVTPGLFLMIRQLVHATCRFPNALSQPFPSGQPPPPTPPHPFTQYSACVKRICTKCWSSLKRFWAKCYDFEEKYAIPHNSYSICSPVPIAQRITPVQVHKGIPESDCSILQCCLPGHEAPFHAN